MTRNTKQNMAEETLPKRTPSLLVTSITSSNICRILCIKFSEDLRIIKMRNIFSAHIHTSDLPWKGWLQYRALAGPSLSFWRLLGRVDQNTSLAARLSRRQRWRWPLGLRASTVQCQSSVLNRQASTGWKQFANIMPSHRDKHFNKAGSSSYIRLPVQNWSEFKIKKTITTMCHNTKPYRSSHLKPKLCLCLCLCQTQYHSATCVDPMCATVQ